MATSKQYSIGLPLIAVSRPMAIIALLSVFFQQNIYASDNDIFDFPLEEILSMLITTSTLTKVDYRTVPSSINVITREQIEERGYRTIKEVLLDIPGFTALSDVNEELAGVRGTYATTTNKTLTLINGHRMNGLELGRYNHDQFIGLESVERIEVIKGAGSPLYGSGALNGVINIVIRKGEDIDGTLLHARVGQFRKELSITYGTKQNDLDLLFNFTRRDSTGEEIEQGAELDVSPEGIEDENGVVYAGRYPDNFSSLVIIDNGPASFTLRGTHFERATPRTASGSFYDYSTEPIKPTYTEDDYYVEYKYKWTLDDSSFIEFTPSLHYFRYREQSYITYSAAEIPTLGTRSGVLTEHQATQIKINYSKTVSEHLHVLLGIDSISADWNKRDSHTIVDGAQQVITPNGAHTEDSWILNGYFVQSIWSITEDFTLTTGFRFDKFGDHAESEYSPRIGLVYQADETWVFKALYGRSLMAPNPFQTKSADPNFIGNPNLTSEKFEGINLIISYAPDYRLFIEFDSFLNDSRDFINRDENGIYQNRGIAKFKGFDLSAQYQVFPRINIFGSYSLIRTTSTSTSENLIDGKIKSVPQGVIRYGLRARPSKDILVNIQGRRYGKTMVNDPITNESSIDGANIIDMGITYFQNDLTFQFFVNNLSAKKYQVGDAGSARPLPQAGRWAEAAVSYQF